MMTQEINFVSDMLGLRFLLAFKRIQNNQLDVRVWHSEEEALAQDVNLAVVNMLRVFKALRLNEITNRVNIGEIRKGKDCTLELFNV